MIAEVSLSLALSVTPLSSGTGWKVGNGVSHLDRTGWSIQFYDTYSRTQLSPYVKLTAAELEAKTGVDFYVGTTINRTSVTCPGKTSTGRHRIVVRVDPNTTRSNATVCGVAGAADSSRALFAQGNWNTKTRNGSREAYKRNVVSHELGHSMGLLHPAESELPYTDPLMTGAYWGGYSSWSTAHKYTSYDASGLKQLVLNRP